MELFVRGLFVLAVPCMGVLFAFVDAWRWGLGVRRVLGGFLGVVLAFAFGFGGDAWALAFVSAFVAVWRATLLSWVLDGLGDSAAGLLRGCLAGVFCLLRGVLVFVALVRCGCDGAGGRL
ncbi:hypothetical protein SAMN03159496_04684 [Rhizobium sp. NFR07]|uniref:hypothetical protein n=1 Tax=Rhizobium sp. NFR07 TaxID=1566262 RepID=UPI0008E44354|nr:hypothetical protein [Rhizobium sp. NFR07]SFB52707.1 hypothetical protein SAMN03159496_04684 [Rhizobium sp. NFR07]